MITLTINGLQTSVEEGTTLLEAARFLGFPILEDAYLKIVGGKIDRDALLSWRSE